VTLREGDALWALGAVVVVLQGRRLAARAVDQVAHRVERPLQGQVLDPLHLLRAHKRSQQLQDGMAGVIAIVKISCSPSHLAAGSLPTLTYGTAANAGTQYHCCSVAPRCQHLPAEALFAGRLQALQCVQLALLDVQRRVRPHALLAEHVVAAV
jgi:hypothetical protein